MDWNQENDAVAPIGNDPQPLHEEGAPLPEEDENDDEGDDEEEEEERAPVRRFRSPQDLSRVLERQDPDRMVLTQQEHTDALAIKRIIEGTPEVNPLSDFMYAQFAIVYKREIAQNNFASIIERCHNLQGFREEYRILNTYEDGCRYLQFMLDSFPRHLVSFDFYQSTGSYVHVMDVEKFNPDARFTAAVADQWMRYQYYSHLLFHPDFETIRKGIVLVAECTGMSLRRRMIKQILKLGTEFLNHYPFHAEIRHFHSGAMMNVLVAMFRKVLPDSLLSESFLVGFHFGSGHLADSLMTPSLEEANVRTLGRMQITLRERFENERSFSLE